MALILLGALLVVAGVLFMALQPLKGRLSKLRRLGPRRDSVTLEPEQPGRGFDIRSNVPGLAMVAMGAVLLLIGAAF